MLQPINAHGRELGDLVFASGVLALGTRAWIGFRLLGVVLCIARCLQGAWLEQRFCRQGACARRDGAEGDNTEV